MAFSTSSGRSWHTVAGEPVNLQIADHPRHGVRSHGQSCEYLSSWCGPLVDRAEWHDLTAEGRVSTLNRIDGRMSSMAKQAPERANLLQGTLDMLILRTLLYGPAHGHQIGKHIQRTTNDFLQMQHGSLYPALHRLERRRWVTSKWEMAPDRNREFKYYRLTDKGRKQLVVEESQWKQMAEAVARVMWPAAEES